jgi:hypothetical protein
MNESLVGAQLASFSGRSASLVEDPDPEVLTSDSRACRGGQGGGETDR